MQYPSYSFAPLATAMLAVATSLCAQPQSASSNWQVSASIAVRETHDDNVYLQNVTALAGRESWVSSAALNVSATYQATPAFKAVLSYAPETFVFHSERSEDHLDHRLSAAVSGRSGALAWEIANSLLVIDGKTAGPIFLPGGAIPALGAIPLRDRRESTVFRHATKATWTRGAYFVRPQFTAYVHDFQTEQNVATGKFAGYANYIDRSEVNGGVDVGYKGLPGAWLVGGYRLGRQVQKELCGTESPYTNNYHRFLVGVEGALTPWMKAAVLAGPDVREFNPNPSPAFDGDEVLLFVDATLTLTPTKNDVVTLTMRRFEHPAFASHSVYEDIVYDVTWRRQYGTRVSLTLGFRAYGGDWQAPAVREDWIYTPSALLTYAWSKKWVGELSYSQDSAVSKIPNTANREYDRRLVSVGLKYVF